MCVAGAVVSGSSAVAAQHRAGLPPGQAHEVGLVAALRQPLMREGVAKLVRVEALDAGVTAAAADHLGDARSGHAAELADPQPLQMGGGVAGTRAEVAVKRLGGLAAKRQGPLP